MVRNRTRPGNNYYDCHGEHQQELLLRRKTGVVRRRSGNTRLISFLACLFCSARNNVMFTAMKGGYDKKRILVKARSLYDLQVPAGEENLYFQYTIVTVNDDLRTATMKFDSKCIEKGSDSFRMPQATRQSLTSFGLLFNVRHLCGW